MSDYVRFSVANLVPSVIVEETGKQVFMGLLNRRQMAEGKRVFGAIGGSAELTPMAMELLRERFDAKFENGRDARILIPMRHLGGIVELFERNDPDFCEISAERETMEELAGNELPGFPPVLFPEDVLRLQLQYVKSRHQASNPSMMRASANPGDPPTQRYLHLHQMTVPWDILQRMSDHPAVRFYSEQELATTQGGLMWGMSAGRENIASNLFL